MNLTNRTELFVNFKRAELKFKKKIVSSRVSSRTNSYRVESSSDRFDSTRLISSSTLHFNVSLPSFHPSHFQTHKNSIFTPHKPPLAPKNQTFINTHKQKLIPHIINLSKTHFNTKNITFLPNPKITTHPPKFLNFTTNQH